MKKKFLNIIRKGVLVIAILSIAANGILLSSPEGDKVADVYKLDIKNGEVIIGSPNASDNIKMGDLLYVRIDGKVVLLRTSFPMMTSAKCKPEGKNYILWTKAIKGMAVYRFKNGIEDQENEIAQNKNYKIGDHGPAGGWIFYDKGSYSDGWRYLEAAPVDQSVGIQWYNVESKVTGATGTAIGTGKLNTQKIIAVQGNGQYAAKICTDYRGSGKSDWFLPSKDELNLIYANLYKADVGGFVSTNLYWSSSEFGALLAWCQFFYNGSQYDEGKQFITLVRAIRSF